VVRIKGWILWYAEEDDVLDSFDGMAHEEVGSTCKRGAALTSVDGKIVPPMVSTSYLYIEAVCAVFDGTGLVPASLPPAVNIH
jgi:hypothetical protein